jgi:hypothetical protein
VITVDPNTGDISRVARAEFPLDFDRRHTVTGIFRARVSENAGPKLMGLRLLGGLETAAIGRVSSGLPYSYRPGR